MSLPALPVVIDTHVLLWWALDPTRLSESVRALCHQAEEEGRGLILSSISIWEIGTKIKRGKLDLRMSVEDFADRVEQLGYVDCQPVDTSLWLRNLRLDWAHRDPADRTIVALAERGGLPLLTRDKVISEFYPRGHW